MNKSLTKLLFKLLILLALLTEVIYNVSAQTFTVKDSTQCGDATGAIFVSGLDSTKHYEYLLIPRSLFSKPVISLLGDNPVRISVGSTYTDAGATAYDSQFGDLTSSIVAMNNVNTATVGSYTITYSVINPNGIAAEELVRTVLVENINEWNYEGVMTVGHNEDEHLIYYIILDGFDSEIMGDMSPDWEESGAVFLKCFYLDANTEEGIFKGLALGIHNEYSESLLADTGSFIIQIDGVDYYLSNYGGGAWGYETETNPFPAVDEICDIKLKYTLIPTYTLTVTNGTGSGTYSQDELVEIVADAPEEGFEFAGWTGDVQYLDDSSNSTAHVTMPNADVNVEATYREISVWLYVKNYISTINEVDITTMSYEDIKELVRVVTEDYTISFSELYYNGLITLSRYKVSYVDDYWTEGSVRTIFTYYDYNTEERIYDTMNLVVVDFGVTDLDYMAVVPIVNGEFDTDNTLMFSGNPVSVDFISTYLLPE